MLAALAMALLAAAPAPELPAVAGWTAVDPARYTPENLYEVINGAADAFIAFDVETLDTAEYRGPNKAVVSVDLYRHRDPVRAFGIYSQERSPARPALPVGVEGTGDATALQFVIGAAYVKLALVSPPGSADLLAFAKKLAEGLKGTRAPPALLVAFPAKGRKARTEKLAARDFLGHAFLHDAATAAYEGGFRLFALDAKDEADARAMVRRWLEVGKQQAPEVPPAEAVIADPLHGKVLVRWKGKWVWGAVDAGAETRTELVDALGQALTRLR